MGRSGARLVALAIAAALLASGCWQQSGAGPGQRFHNPWETTLTAERVGDLHPVWTLDGRAEATFGNSILVADGATLRAVSPVDGAELWAVSLPTSAPHLGLRADSVVTVGAQIWVSWSGDDCMGGFAQLHAGTGAVLREEAAAIGTMRFLTASDEGFVATVSGCTTPGSTAVLDPTTWSTRFQLPPPPTSGPGGAVQAHPAQGGGRYFDDGGTTVRAFDLDGCGQPTCQPDWEVAVPGDAGAWQIAVSSDGSSVYAGTTTVPALVVRLDAATGDELGRMVLAGPQLGTFAIADGVLFAATEHDLEAFDAGCTGTCAPLWSSGIPGVRTPMAVGAGVVHVRTGTTTVESFDASGCGAPTCTPIGTTEVSHDGLLVANGRLLTTDGDGTTAYAPG